MAFLLLSYKARRFVDGNSSASAHRRFSTRISRPSMNERNHKVFELHRVARLPINLNAPIYRHYSALKLGVRRSARYYALQLVPIVRELMRAGSQSTHWILTAPPLRRIAASANLLCWELRALLANQPTTLSCVNLFSRNAASEPGLADSYSALDAEARVRVCEREGIPEIRDQDFRGRGVIVVNDMRVTGAQERHMARYLAETGAAAVYWLYVLNIDLVTAKLTPAIENTINHSSFSSFAAFAHLITNQEMHYTRKCLTRLFSCKTIELEYILRQLDELRISRLYALASSERRFSTAAFASKMDLLRTYGATTKRMDAAMNYRWMARQSHLRH